MHLPRRALAGPTRGPFPRAKNTALRRGFARKPRCGVRWYDAAFATRPVRRDREAGDPIPGARGAEGATRPETLRQNNGSVSRTLESGPRRVAATNPPKGCGARWAHLISQVQGQRGDRRRPVAPFALRKGRAAETSERRAHAAEDSAVRAPSRARRAHRRFRRLGHAAALWLADRRAPRGAARRRHVRRLAHAGR